MSWYRTTLTSFATPTDITVAELQLEAFLPADEASAGILRDRLRRSPPGRPAVSFAIGAPSGGARP
jgi:hypothetical protein